MVKISRGGWQTLGQICQPKWLDHWRVNFLRTIKAMWPAAHERKSSLDKAAKVGFQVPFFLTVCLRFD